MAKLLTDAGIRCGHEEIFTPVVNYEENIQKCRQGIAESSWLAAPFIGLPFLDETTIIHAVRDPIAVINSHVTNKIHRRDSVYFFYAATFVPEILSMDALEAATYFYVAWNRLIERRCIGRKVIFHRVEDEPDTLLKSISGDVGRVFNNRRYNTAPESGYPLTWDNICVHRAELRDMARRYGYL